MVNKISWELGTKQKNYGLEKCSFEKVTSAYIAESKFIKMVVRDIPYTEFEKITGVNLKQIRGQPKSSVKTLMKMSLENRLIHLKHKQTIFLYNIAVEQSVEEALKALYVTKKLK